MEKESFTIGKKENFIKTNNKRIKEKKIKKLKKKNTDKWGILLRVTHKKTLNFSH